MSSKREMEKNVVSMVIGRLSINSKEDKKRVKNWYLSNITQGDDYLAHREKIANKIANRAENNIVHVLVTSIDCDHCKGTSRYHIPATVMHFEKLENMAYEDAEGPTSVSVMTAEQNDEYKPEFRDYLAEAYEDGHPHVVYY